MPRDGAITFSDLVGKLDHLEIEHILTLLSAWIVTNTTTGFGVGCDSTAAPTHAER